MEHFWLAILREGDGVAANVLRQLGVDFDKAREELLIQLRTQPYGNAAGMEQERPTEKSKGKQETPTLAQYSRDLTQAARQSELDPVIGRDGEIQRIIQILSRRTKNNPVLIGEPGVGKSEMCIRDSAMPPFFSRFVCKMGVPQKLLSATRPWK